MYFICIVTANQTKWDQHDNTTRLDERINDITVWKISLERCIADTNDEILVILLILNDRQGERH